MTENTSKSDKIAKLREMLAESRQWQDDFLEHGFDAAYLYADDVEGDWLETWGDEDEDEDEVQTELGESKVAKFLASDAEVVVRLRKEIGRTLQAADVAFLEKCLQLPEFKRPSEMASYFQPEDDLVGCKEDVELEDDPLFDVIWDLLEELNKLS